MLNHLLTDADRVGLLANGRRSRTQPDYDPQPIVKLFCPDGGVTFLLSEIDPADPDVVYGLCDLGLGCPELGSASLSTLAEFRSKMRLSLEKDAGFRATRTLGAYAAVASAAGRILT